MKPVVFLLSVLFFCTLHKPGLSARRHEAPTLSPTAVLPRGASIPGIVEVTEEPTPGEELLSNTTPTEFPPSPTAEHPTPPQTSTMALFWSEFPQDIFSMAERRRGWVLLHILGVLYMLVALTVVCKEFFVPALWVFTDKLAISDDVAGAAFIAAGRSFPKLLTSALGALVAPSFVGFGSIVGSAVFNIVFLMGVCAVLAREVLRLSCWSFWRDVSFYVFDLILLVLFFLDNMMMWWESVMLVASYTMYAVFMRFNTQIQRFVKTQMNNSDAAFTVQETDMQDVPLEESGGQKNKSDGCENQNDKGRDDGKTKGEEPLSLAWPHTPSKQAAHLFLLPIVLPLWLTLPDVRRQKSRKFCVLTFLGSVLWIAVFSYCMVWWTDRVGETLHVPVEVLGLTVLAVGTSIPDIITSVSMARKGRGDMTVCTLLGNNIFNITVCLPVPVLLSSAFHGLYAVAVSSEGILCSVTLLFITLLFFIVSIASSNWRINKVLGVTMLLFYLIFVGLSVILQFRLIVCPLDLGE